MSFFGDLNKKQTVQWNLTCVKALLSPPVNKAAFSLSHSSLQRRFTEMTIFRYYTVA